MSFQFEIYAINSGGGGSRIVAILFADAKSLNIEKV